jgi:3'-phosphoadenosine 5'-phosphosulfate sulfotransferase (PAPS reductase)/FAD synthetase
MLLVLIERRYPLDEVLFYDTGKEFQAMYNLRDKVVPLLENKGIKYTELYPPQPFDYMMFSHKTKSGKTGYGWCGGRCRWGTTYKIRALDSIGCKTDIRYVGIAQDELKRIEKDREPKKVFPLADWGMTEKDCLEYCCSHGYNWDENGIELCSVLSRVSCWCCRNKNLKELKGVYRNLPDYWQRLKDIQARLPDPMKGAGKSVFDLEERFKAEIAAETGLTGQKGHKR